MAQVAVRSRDRQRVGARRRGGCRADGEGRRTRRRVRCEGTRGPAREPAEIEVDLAAEAAGGRDRDRVTRAVSSSNRLAGRRDRQTEVGRGYGAGADREVLGGPLGEAEESRADQLVAAPDDAGIARVWRGTGVVAPPTGVGRAVALEEGLLVERRAVPKDDFAGVHRACWC